MEWRLKILKSICNEVLDLCAGKVKKPKKHDMLDIQYDLVFEHGKYGRIALSAGINPLTGDWMWWWDRIDKSMSVGNKNDIKKVVKDIRKQKTKVYLDTFDFVR